MLVAPSERHPLTTLGKHSSLPEQYGCDILFPVKGTWVGVQRKEINDLVASVYDGRLSRELVMMKRCSLSVLVVEGKPQWTMDGELMGRGNFGMKKGNGSSWSKTQHRGLLNSVRSQGVWTDQTETAQDTVEFCLALETWLKKEKHSLLVGRPGPETVWGSPSNLDFQRHILMGFPGIGVTTADQILETIGMPLRWSATAEELMTVPGIGKKKAEQILGCLR